jgi:predicted RNA-binding Zn-ribbon protein involved in translation (DUF1610 family)
MSQPATGRMRAYNTKTKYVVQCFACGLREWSDYVNNRSEGAKDLRENLLWKTSQGRWLCPNCAKRQIVRRCQVCNGHRWVQYPEKCGTCGGDGRDIERR